MSKKKNRKPNPVPNPLPESSVPPTTEKSETTMTAPEVFALPHPNEDPAKLDAPFTMTRRILLDIVEVMLNDAREEAYGEGYEVGRREGIREALSRAVETLGKKKVKVETTTAQTQTPSPPILIHSAIQCEPIGPLPTTTISASMQTAMAVPADHPSNISQDSLEAPPSSCPRSTAPVIPSTHAPPLFDWADDAHNAALNNPPKYTPRDFSALRSDSTSNPFASLHRRCHSPKLKQRSFPSAYYPKTVPVFSVPTSAPQSDKIDSGNWVFIPSSVLATVLGYNRRRGRRHV